MHDLRPLAGARAETIAEGIGALIDGLYLRHALKGAGPAGHRAAEMVLDYLDRELAEGAS